MLDDEARRALEQEAIALVNLSNSQPLTKKRPAPSAAEELVAHKRQQPHADTPVVRGAHAMLLPSPPPLATRCDDGHRAPFAHRVKTTSAAALHHAASGPNTLKPLLSEERRLSMLVFVNADGRMTTIAPGGKASPDHHAEFELTAMDPTCLKDDTSASPTSATATTDSHLSIQSLLVNLKARKPDNDSDAGAPKTAPKLPRFRDLFEPQLPTIKMQTAPSVAYVAQPPAAAVVASASAPASPPAVEDAPAVEDSPLPPPPELKCKYRTGKCGNQRALKSCGDYHNLCNYHRLRANANQRKLDRKKKVQRAQPTASTGSSSAAAASPVAAVPPKLVAPPAVSAAATTLASMPASFLMPRASPPPSGAHHQQASVPFLAYLVPPPANVSTSTSLLRPKPEGKSC